MRRHRAPAISSGLGSAGAVSLRLRSASSMLLPLRRVSHLASAEDGLYAIIYLCQTLLPATMHP